MMVSCTCGCVPLCGVHSALLCQKEASDIPSKSELIDVYIFYLVCSSRKILCINSHPPKRYVR